MSLIYDPESDAQHIFIYCLMGAVPREKEAQALRRLLEINFLTYQHSAPMMGIDPETGQVFFAFQANLGAINPMLALDTMEMAAKQVQKWRQTYFLEETFDLTSHNQPVSFV